MDRGIRRFRLRTILTVFLVGGMAGIGVNRWFGVGGGASPAWSAPSAEAALDQRIPEVMLEDVPLDEAVRRVAQLAGVGIVLDTRLMELQHVSLHTKVTVRLRNATLATILDQLAAHLRSPRDLDGEWYVDRGEIHLSLESPDLPPRLLPRSYDVQDLLQSSLPDPPLYVARTWTGQRFSRGPVGQRVTASIPPSPESSLESLVQTMLETRYPNAPWRTPSPRGTLRCLGGRLLAVQTQWNHRAIREFLDELRTIAPKTPAVSPLDGTQRWEERLNRWVSNDARAAEGRLLQKVGEFRVTTVSPKSAIEQAAAITDTEVLIDRPALAMLQAMPGITVGLRDAPAADVLDAVLKAAAPAPQGESALDWALDGDLLVVFVRNQYVGKNSVVRQYDLRDWFRAAELGASPAPFQRIGIVITERRPATHDQIAERLATHLVDAIDPLSWRNRNGQVGRIEEMGGFLLVTQTYSNQERIRRFVELLRRDVQADSP